MISARKTFTSTVSLTNELPRLKTFAVWSSSAMLLSNPTRTPTSTWTMYLLTPTLSCRSAKRLSSRTTVLPRKMPGPKLLKNGLLSLSPPSLRSRLLSARPRRSLHLRRSSPRPKSLLHVRPRRLRRRQRSLWPRLLRRPRRPRNKPNSSNLRPRRTLKGP